MRTFSFTAVFLILAATLEAEVIDGIAATVGKQVITESQIAEEIRVTAFLNGKAATWSDENRTRSLNRLVDQTLIRHEIEATRFAEATPEEGIKLLANLKAQMKDFDQRLASEQLTPTVVTRHLLWQVTFLRFVEYRFRPGVEASDADLRELYATQVTQWRTAGKPVPSFEEARPELEKVLTSRFVDQALDRWLGDQRTQISIIFKTRKKAGQS